MAIVFPLFVQILFFPCSESGSVDLYKARQLLPKFFSGLFYPNLDFYMYFMLFDHVNKHKKNWNR